MVKGITIGVVGLGYVGLPTALAFHEAGFGVIGVDINKTIVETIRSGESHLSDISSEIIIPPEGENWKVYSDFPDSLQGCGAILITVPTPVNDDRTPNLDFVESAMRSVIKKMDKDSETVLVVESTVFPGATMRVFNDIKEEMGQNFPNKLRIAYSPERVSPGEEGKSAQNIAKIVGSNDEETGLFLADLYSEITNKGCKYVGSIEVAEAAKMIENTQRDIDIAFINELSRTLPLMGLDVMDVIDAASTKWNFHRHTPGIGVGGHCIPVDPYYYIQSARDAGSDSTLSPAARQINESMPIIAADKIISELPKSATVLVLGLAYKPGVGDLRESPAIELVQYLDSKGVATKIWDPLVPLDLSLGEIFEIVDDPYRGAEDVDMVILATGHPQCLSLDWKRIANLVKVRKLFDGPRLLSKSHIRSLGFDYFGVGVPDEYNN